MIPRDVVLAAMTALEEETIQRCIDQAKGYAALHSGSTSKISTAKANGALNVATRIRNITRKSA